MQLDLATVDEWQNRSKLLKALGEFEVYIECNRAFIPNFGERYRNQERISTAFVESTVNQVISKRMVKQQQLRATVLNNELEGLFRRWYPNFRTTASGAAEQKAAA